MRKLLFILPIVFIILAFKNNVNAAYSIDADSSYYQKDDIGHCVLGYIFKDASEYRRLWNFKNNDGFYYIEYDSSQGNWAFFVHNVIKENDNYVDNDFFYDNWLQYNDRDYYDEETINGHYQNLGFGMTCMVGQTNIPIFDVNDPDYEEKLQNYFENGEYYTDDENYDIPREYDESIELPQNLRLTSGYEYNILSRQRLLFPDKDIVINWEQSVDTADYSYEVELKYNLDHVTKTNLLGQETTENYSSDYVAIGNGLYQGNKNVTYKIEHNTQWNELKNISQSNNWTGTKSYISNIFIRVRNIKGNKCSNWVVVSLDIPNKSASATVQDDDGNNVVDDQYNNYDAINGDQVNSDNVGSLSDFKKITDFIKNGFNLLGKGGLVGLLSSFFGNIFPQSFWNIITTGMAVVILVGIINFLLKR